MQQNNNESLFNKAINKAGCKEFISKLVLKDNTYVTRLFDSNGVELSGGENQRLALARTFFKNAQIILLNEPTSALDPSLTLDVAKLIKSLSKTGMSMLIITHDMEFAKLVSDKIVSMDSGKIIEKHIYNKCEII